LPGEKSTAVRVPELRRLAGLEGLPPAKLGLLSKHMRGLRLRKGEVLYHPGQPAKHIYCVLDGTIGLSLLGTDGRFVELGLRAAGEFFGVTALVPGWRRASEAKALQDSRVGQVDAATFVSKVWDLPWESLAGLTKMLLKPVFLLSLRRSLFLVEQLPDRLALVLWELRRPRGLLPPTLTQEELAAMVGASRPRVSLALKRLEDAGLFVREGKRIRLQDKPLRAYLERRYESLL
jgi:CRP-like cAMP-binding protein